ncbi:MAG TPA: MscL family protein [Nitrososphaerales archaeon]|nr:MscL family protein [Nitrososphaerales archaeon]
MDSNEEILAELRRIAALLEKPPEPPAPPAPKGMAQEFKAFLSQYKVLGLAVAFILGLYLGNVVKALVTDLILPIVSYALPPGTDINHAMAGPFGVGDFANNVLTFIIVALVIFLIVKAANKYKIA